MRVKRVIGQKQLLEFGICQCTPHEREVEVLVAAVELVTDDGVPAVGEMYSNLVFAACPGNDSKECEIACVSRESADNPEFGQSLRAVGPHAILNRHSTELVSAQRRVNEGAVRGHAPSNDG